MTLAPDKSVRLLEMASIFSGVARRHCIKMSQRSEAAVKGAAKSSAPAQ